MPLAPICPEFVQEVMDFVGLTDADIDMIRRSAPTLLRHERAITDALYEHFLKFPAAARFFLLPDGTPDQPRLERRNIAWDAGCAKPLKRR